MYLTVSTYNRPWHFSLTMLCLANAERPPGLFVRVIDDGSDDGSQEWRRAMLADLLGRGLVQQVDFRAPDLALPGPARYNAVFGDTIAGFLQSGSPLWLHLDDDLCFAPELLTRAANDFDRWRGRGVLYLFINAWRNVAQRHYNGPLWHVNELGGCAFLASRAAIEAIGNIFATREGQLRRHEDLWQELRGAREPLLCNRDKPYAIQHTANTDSLLFGHKEQWREAWQHHLITREPIDVPPFGFAALRQAVNGYTLEAFVRQWNAKLPVPILLAKETPDRSDG